MRCWRSERSVVKPLFETPVPQADIDRGDGEWIVDFIEATCKIAKGGVGGSAGSLLAMRPWQYDLLGKVFARRPDGRYRHRTALIGLPRKNGKSALGSAIALERLITGEGGTEIYSCAGSLDQARIVFSTARRMVEMNPDLSDRIKPYQRILENKDNGSIYKVLSADAPMQEGLNPSLVIFDELHVQPTYELWNVMNLAFGARIDPLMLAITTAGVKHQADMSDTVCYWLYQYIQKIATGEIDDPTTYGAWFGVPQDLPYDSDSTWAAANPGYGDLLDPADFQSVVRKIPENEFRTKRLNQWVSSSVAWLPQGSWDKLPQAAGTDPASGATSWVLGFDGDRAGKYACLVAARVGNPRVEVIKTWSAQQGDEDYQVPREEVKQLIRTEASRRNAAEIAWQEFLWPSDAEQLTDEGLPVVTFKQTTTMMTPATQRMFELVTTGQVTHDGNPELSRHMGNVQVKTDSRGTRLLRNNNSLLAIASVMANDRAGFWATSPDRPGFYKGVAVDKLKFVW